MGTRVLPLGSNSGDSDTDKRESQIRGQSVFQTVQEQTFRRFSCFGSGEKGQVKRTGRTVEGTGMKDRKK